MSMTQENFTNWCDAVSKTNQAVFELYTQRQENYAWMGNELREFFSQFGQVVNVHFETDASEITVRMEPGIKFNSDFKSLPFKFSITADVEGMDDYGSFGDILFHLKPDVITMEDLKQD